MAFNPFGANPMDMFSPKTPSGPGFVGLDPGTQGLMAAGASNAGRDAQAFADEANKGVGGAAQSFMPSGSQASQGAAAMGTQPGATGFDTALRNQYASLAGKNVNKIVQGNQVNDQLMKAQALRQQTAAFLGQQRAVTQNYEALTQAYNANEQARAQFIGQLFGAVNYGIGSKMAGGKSTPFDVDASGGQAWSDNGGAQNFGNIA